VIRRPGILRDTVKPPPVRAVCFDLFNTLVNVGRVPASVGITTADILGLDPDTWRRACFGEHHDICGPTDPLDNLRRMAHAIDPAIPEPALRRAVAHRQRRFDHALENVDAGVLESLQALRATGIRLALVSNASTAEVRAWPGSPLAPLFHRTLFSCERGCKKPEPNLYRLALAELGVEANECLFVGDGGSDEHQGAHAVGMRPVLMTWHLDDARERELRNRLEGVLFARVASVAEVLTLVTKGE